MHREFVGALLQLNAEKQIPREQLFTRDLLLGIELKEGAHELAMHLHLRRSRGRCQKETWGSPTFEAAV